MSRKFAHRSNSDGTAESICIRCFQTVAKVSDETDMPKLEQKHICDPNILARFDYANLFNKKAEKSNES